MNADTCKDFLNALEPYHDRKFTSMARDQYWSELKDYSDEKIVLALQASYGKFPPGRVPSINDIKALLADIRETAQAREKGAEMANRYPLSRSRPKSIMGKESLGITNRLCFPQGDPEKLSGCQCVEEMLKMEEKYPGVGWGRGASELAAWLDKKERRDAEEKLKSPKEEVRHEKEGKEDWDVFS